MLNNFGYQLIVIVLFVCQPIFIQKFQVIYSSQQKSERIRQQEAQRKISLHKKFEITQAKVKEKYRIYSITSFSVSNKGHIYTLGIKNRILQMFNSKKGKFEKAIEIEGKGYNLSLATGIDGHVYVADPGMNRIMEFDENLNELNSISIAIPDRSVNFDLDKENNFYFCYPAKGYMVHKFSKHGNYLISFASPPKIRHLYNGTDDRFFEKYIKKQADLGFVVLDDNCSVFYLNCNPSEIQKLGDSGDLKQKIQIPGDFIFPINEYVKVLPENLVLFRQRGGAYALLVSIKNEIIVTNMLCPSFAENDVDVTRWDSSINFFDLQGNLLDSLNFNNRMFQGLEEDEDGYIYLLDRTNESKIIKYSIEKNY